MTIYDYDTATAGHDGGSPERGHSTHAVVDRLSVGEPYAVAFGGQGGAWLENLEELVSSAGIESELNEIVGEAELLLEPLARELVVVRPIGFEPMQWVRALAAEEPLPATKQLTSAALSFPGILLTQMAAIRALTRQGLDLTGTPPVAMAGHSQGVLGVESLKAGGARDVELLAMAQLIGAAGSLVSRRCGMVVRGGKSPMVSVTNADPDRIAELLDEFAQDVRTVLPPVLSIRNGRRAVVITGTPEQLSRFELYCQQITEKEEAERKNKLRGGDVFRPVFQAVQVEVGFHTPRLADGIALVDQWAEKVGIDTELAHDMAEAIFVRPVDWVSEVERLCEADAKWIIDLGPSDTATRLTAPVIRGSAIGIVPAATRAGPAQPVHRRCDAGDTSRRGRATAPTLVYAARRLGEAVDQVHPADRAVADPARGYDADDCGREDRRRGGQRRALGRAGRRRPGHRGDLRGSHRGVDRAVGAWARSAVQLAVPGSVSVEVAGGRKTVGAEGPSVGRADRRCGGIRGHPRSRRKPSS